MMLYINVLIYKKGIQDDLTADQKKMFWQFNEGITRQEHSRHVIGIT